MKFSPFNTIILGAILLLGFVVIWKYSEFGFEYEWAIGKQIVPQKDFEDFNVTKLEEAKRDWLKAIEKINLEDFIAARLAEANLNWLRGVQARKNVEEKHLLDEVRPWSFKNHLIFWDLFYPNFDCPHTVERIGRSGDGGKWICGVNHIARKAKNCIVYSYGISSDTSFEKGILDRTKCSIFMFDHTININNVKLPEKYPGRAIIEKVGLGVQDSTRVRSLLSTMKKYEHDFIDILKIDVEGTEFTFFNNIQNDFPDGLPFGQLAMEIHLPSVAKNWVYLHSTWMENLEQMGLRAFRNEFNLYGARKVPTLCEFSFINVKVDNFLLHD